MTFYEYMMKFINDESPLGDLAYDMKSDKEFPKQSKDSQELRGYFYTKAKSDLVFKISKQAISSYARVEKYL
ncbi:hypothetical protein HIR19_03790 [Staphylococcus coagulans]|uniref:sterile alpha motif-like domain-containing protein n=1 Tax=Staphylococcus coagulans TaxID=74706 RepID=UPI001BE9864B|nr:sterile alpha motif-like domain-containing protein [Staphylococcus coagulans]MBT2823088.1 hypothetical protein [Staphylococcus coagulans]